MKSIPYCFTGLLLAVITCASTAIAADDAYYYSRASYADVSPKENGLVGDAGGVLLAFGMATGPVLKPARHYYETELGWADWSESGSITSGGTTVTGTYSLRAMPLLFTYRRAWQLSDRISFAAGPSLGITRFSLKGSGTFTGATTGTFAGADTSLVFSYGVGALLAFQVTDKVSIDVGYRYLMNQKPSFFGTGAGNFDTHILQFGVGWKW